MALYTIELSDQQIAQYKHLASQTTWDEQCLEAGDVINDFAGDNVDDAYDGGVRAGEVYEARNILTLCGIDWGNNGSINYTI